MKQEPVPVVPKAKDPSHFKVLCKSVNVDETVDFS